MDIKARTNQLEQFCILTIPQQYLWVDLHKWNANKANVLDSKLQSNILEDSSHNYLKLYKKDITSF